MRIQVTEENIDKYELDKLTGNSKEDLLNAAARAAEFEKDFYVKIDDVEGGDTEIPTDRNIFSHYGDLPDPDGRSHEQEAVDLTRTENRWVEVPCTQPCHAWGVMGHTHWEDTDDEYRQWVLPPGLAPWK